MRQQAGQIVFVPNTSLAEITESWLAFAEATEEHQYDLGVIDVFRGKGEWVAILLQLSEHAARLKKIETKRKPRSDRQMPDWRSVFKPIEVRARSRAQVYNSISATRKAYGEESVLKFNVSSPIDEKGEDGKYTFLCTPKTKTIQHSNKGINYGRAYMQAQRLQKKGLSVPLELKFETGKQIYPKEREILRPYYNLIQKYRESGHLQGGFAHDFDINPLAFCREVRSWCATKEGLIKRFSTAFQVSIDNLPVPTLFEEPLETPEEVKEVESESTLSQHLTDWQARCKKIIAEDAKKEAEDLRSEMEAWYESEAYISHDIKLLAEYTTCLTNLKNLNRLPVHLSISEDKIPGLDFTFNPENT